MVSLPACSLNLTLTGLTAYFDTYDFVNICLKMTCLIANASTGTAVSRYGLLARSSLKRHVTWPAWVLVGPEIWHWENWHWPVGLIGQEVGIGL